MSNVKYTIEDLEEMGEIYGVDIAIAHWARDRYGINIARERTPKGEAS